MKPEIINVDRINKLKETYRADIEDNIEVVFTVTRYQLTGLQKDTKFPLRLQNTLDAVINGDIKKFQYNEFTFKVKNFKKTKTIDLSEEK